MAKSTRNTGKPWSQKDIEQLKALAAGNTPTGIIGLKLGRTKGSIQAKAGQEGISLQPANRSPYN